MNDLILKNIFEDEEQSREATTEESSVVYRQFDQGRKRQEALAADQQDEPELKALETKRKRRPKK
jgi:hypothetical protein